jgi:uncharacterized YccA/Bax inhibitor family protein
MTLQGTVNKTGISPAHPDGGGRFVWNSPVPPSFILLGLVGGLVIALVTIFKNTAAPFTTPLYAAFEGLLLGGISLSYEQRYRGHRHQRVGLTFGTLAVLLAVYSTGSSGPARTSSSGSWPRPAPSASCTSCRWCWVLRQVDPVIHERRRSGSASACSWSASRAEPRARLRLHRARRGRGAPKYMEWVGAFGLLVTLVWLYIEILRLLAKLQEAGAR